MYMEQIRINDDMLYPNFDGLDTRTLIGEPLHLAKGYMSVSYDNEGFYALRGKIINNKLVILDAYYEKRTTDVPYLDVISFLRSYVPTNEPMAIVGNYEAVIKSVFIDLDNTDVETLVAWNADTFTNVPEGTYDYEFFTRHIPGSQNEGLLYIVGLRKDDLYEVSSALDVAESRIKIIDYWPAQALYIYSCRNGVVLGNVEEGILNLYGWWNGGFICHKQCDLQIKLIIDNLKQIEEEFYKYGIEEIQSLVIYNKESIDNEELLIDLDAICQEYGEISKLPIIYKNGTEQLVKDESLPWMITLGLLMRGLNYSDINR